MSESKKSIAKVVAMLVALVAAGGGADAAGVMPELGQIEDLGLIGAFALIGYLHLVWLPLVKGMDGKLDKALTSTSALPEAVEDMPPVPKRAATHPGLKVMKPLKDRP